LREKGKSEAKKEKRERTARRFPKRRGERVCVAVVARKRRRKERRFTYFSLGKARERFGKGHEGAAGRLIAMMRGKNALGKKKKPMTSPPP